LGLNIVATIEAAVLQLRRFESRYFSPSLSSQQDFVLEGRGGVKARGFCAAKRTLDTAPAFHTMAMESEGKKLVN